jgi:hypothetical protein
VWKDSRGEMGNGHEKSRPRHERTGSDCKVITSLRRSEIRPYKTIYGFAFDVVTGRAACAAAAFSARTARAAGALPGSVINR